MTRTPLVDRIEALKDAFPELGDDMLGRTAKLIVLPQLKRVARSDPEQLEQKVREFLIRFVQLLEIGPRDLYSDAQILAAATAAAPADR